MRRYVPAIMAAAVLAAALAAPAAWAQSASVKYFQNSRDRLDALAARATKMFGATDNPAEKISLQSLIMICALRSASAETLAQLLDIRSFVRDPADKAQVQAKIVAIRQSLPVAIRAEIKQLNDIAGLARSQDLAKITDDVVKELKVLLNNLENSTLLQS